MDMEQRIRDINTEDLYAEVDKLMDTCDEKDNKILKNNKLHREHIAEKDKQIDKLKADVQVYKQYSKHAIHTSMVNDWTDMCYADIPAKRIFINDDHYAFVKDKEEATGASTFALWVYQSGVGVEDTECADDWCEVSDLTGVPVWVYQELKSYAVAIGWKTDDQDLFI